jgi:16S rRNA processing protein RimM
MEYIGTITGIKGFKGEIFVSDVPVGIENLKTNAKIGVGFSPKFLKYYTVKTWRYSKKKSVLGLNELKNENDANKLIEQGVFIEKEDIVTKELGLTDEIIGCKVYNIENGEELGKIVDVWYLPANNVWLLRMKNGNLPLPVIDDVIKEVDFENEKIMVNLIPGLLSILEPFDNEKK